MLFLLVIDGSHAQLVSVRASGSQSASVTFVLVFGLRMFLLTLLLWLSMLPLALHERARSGSRLKLNISLRELARGSLRAPSEPMDCERNALILESA